jgi:hypothetical protein
MSSGRAALEFSEAARLFSGMRKPPRAGAPSAAEQHALLDGLFAAAFGRAAA